MTRLPSKKKRSLFIVLSVGLLVTAAFVAYNAPFLVIASSLSNQQAFLLNSETFTLYSLDPIGVLLTGNEKADAKALKDYQTHIKVNFHGYPILGQTSIKGHQQRAALLNTLYKGIRDSSSAYGVMCFNPRHGIHAQSGKHFIDLLICFECSQIVVYTDMFGGNTFTTNSPQKYFDQVLQSAKVPLIQRTP